MAKRGSSGGFVCGKVAGKRAKAVATLEKGTPPKEFAGLAEVPGLLIHSFKKERGVLKKQPKWKNESNLGRPRDHFSSKRIIVGLPFGIDFSICFEKDENVK